MKKPILFSLLFLLFFSFSTLAAEEFPLATGFANDYAGTLSSEEKGKLESLCKELESKTSAELAVAIVKTTSPLDPKMYAVKLFEKWKIGKKGKDNGILMLVAMEERRVEIEVGYGLEGDITDAIAGKILDDYVIPYFKQGEFGEGIFNGAAAIAAKIASSKDQKLSYSPADVRVEDYSDEFPLPVIFLAVFFFCLIVGFAVGTFAMVILFALSLGSFGALVAGVVGSIVGAFIGAVFGFILFKFGFKGFGGSGGNWTSGSSGSFGGGWSSGGWSSGGGGSSFGGGSSGGGGAGRSW